MEKEVAVIEETFAWAKPFLWMAGQLMLWGWGLAVLLMVIGMLLMLIAKPFTASPPAPKDAKPEKLTRKNRVQLTKHCYKHACADLVFNAARSENQKAATASPKFTKLDDSTGKILYPMEWQLSLWHKMFDWFLFTNKPSFLAQILNIVLVTPFTNITALSLYYQLYLNEIFHTGFFSRFIHFVMMPLITWVYFLFGTYFSLNDVLHFLHLGFLESNIAEQWHTFLVEHLGNIYLVDLLAINGGFAILVSFSIWYFLWGFSSRAFALGFCMTPLLGVMWVVANGFSHLTRYETGPWYWHSPWWANWIVLGCIFAFIQAFSHAPEPLPPRVNRTAHWMSLTAFYQETNIFVFLFVVLGQMVWGTFDEFWAGPRLLPLLVLKVLYMLGYNPKQWKSIYRVSTLARKLGNPALDYIGIGGALQPGTEEVYATFKPPATYEEAKDQKQELARKFKVNGKIVKPKPTEKAKWEEWVKYQALRSLILRTKANKYAFGPFVADTEDRKNHQAVLAKASPGDVSYRAFMDLVRQDLFNVEASRQADLYKAKNPKKRQ